MLPKLHILFGGIFSLILYFFFNINFLNSLIVFLASVLIDVDHYIWYLFKKRNPSFFKAYTWLRNLPKNHKPIVDIFHTIEFLVFIVILSFIWIPFLFILIGLVFHSIFDLIDLMSRSLRVYNNREFLLTRYLLTKDKSKYF